MASEANPTLTQTFNDAAAPPPAHETVGSEGAAQQTPQHEVPSHADPAADEALRRMLEEQRATLEAARHHRPDDPALVRHVNSGIEANREQTIRSLTPEPERSDPEPEQDLFEHDYDDGPSFEP